MQILKFYKKPMKLNQFISNLRILMNTMNSYHTFKNRIKKRVERTEKKNQIEKLMEKCVIIGILTKTGAGLDEKHREELAKQLIREAYNHLVKCEEAIHRYKQSKLAIAYINSDRILEDLAC